VVFVVVVDHNKKNNVVVVVVVVSVDAVLPGVAENVDLKHFKIINPYKSLYASIAPQSRVLT